MPKLPLRLLIFASGAGSNARALIEHARRHPDRFQVVGLVSDRPGIPALAMAESLGVSTHLINHRDESSLVALLGKLRPDWALLAGYKRIMGAGFLQFFADPTLGFRVMNVHPSLLPAYPGLGGYERAFRDGVTESGVTVHLVDGGLDTGPRILQEAFARAGEDDLASFTAKGQKIEHRLYCQAIDLAATGEIRLGSKR